MSAGIYSFLLAESFLRDMGLEIKITRVDCFKL